MDAAEQKVSSAILNQIRFQHASSEINANSDPANVLLITLKCLIVLKKVKNPPVFPMWTKIMGENSL